MTKEQESYIKAISDIKQAIDSFNKLTSAQRAQALDEVSRMEIIKEILRNQSR